MMAAAVEGLEAEEGAAAEDTARLVVEAADAQPGTSPVLAGNWLNLDLYPGGCHRLLHLCAQQPSPLLQVEFLQLSTHENPGLLETTLAQVPWSQLRLRSLILKGEHLVPGVLVSTSVCFTSASWFTKETLALSCLFSFPAPQIGDRNPCPTPCPICS